MMKRLYDENDYRNRIKIATEIVKAAKGISRTVN
jgi:hypothetical protein